MRLEVIFPLEIPSAAWIGIPEVSYVFFLRSDQIHLAIVAISIAVLEW